MSYRVISGANFRTKFISSMWFQCDSYAVGFISLRHRKTEYWSKTYYIILARRNCPLNLVFINILRKKFEEKKKWNIFKENTECVHWSWSLLVSFPFCLLYLSVCISGFELKLSDGFPHSLLHPHPRHGQYRQGIVHWPDGDVERLWDLQHTHKRCVTSICSRLRFSKHPAVYNHG